MERPRGFTLPEIAFAVAIATRMLGCTVPTFRDLQRNAVRTRDVNQFLQAVYLARGEAIKRNDMVSLCPLVDWPRCAGAGSRWQPGWLAFANLDRDQPADRDPEESLPNTFPAWVGGRLDGNRPSLSFRARGQLAVTGTA